MKSILTYTTIAALVLGVLGHQAHAGMCCELLPEGTVLGSCSRTTVEGRMSLTALVYAPNDDEEMIPEVVSIYINVSEPVSWNHCLKHIPDLCGAIKAAGWGQYIEGVPFKFRGGGPGLYGNTATAHCG